MEISITGMLAKYLHLNVSPVPTNTSVTTATSRESLVNYDEAHAEEEADAASYLETEATVHEAAEQSVTDFGKLRRKVFKSVKRRFRDIIGMIHKDRCERAFDETSCDGFGARMDILDLYHVIMHDHMEMVDCVLALIKLLVLINLLSPC